MDKKLIALDLDGTLLNSDGIVSEATKVHLQKLKEKGQPCTLVNARFVKPLDTDMIDRLCKTHKLIVTMEENVLRGGMGMYVTKYIHEKHPEIRVIQIALPDAYVEHGNVSVLREMLGINSDSVIRRIETEFLNEKR